jgi:uncharacterized protein (DUF433 family)
LYPLAVHAFDLGPAPIIKDEDGVLRVAGTRVTLDSIVAAFDLGATPEDIVQRYPSVDLASAYALIAYVLRHRESVDLYLTERSKAASDVQKEVEAQFPPDGLRARLLARRAEGQ